MKDIELDDCLSYSNWVNQELEKSCGECGETFLQMIDDQTIILQAAELRIVDQLDNLYLLEDPEVDGEPMDITTFSDGKFTAFTDAGIEGEDPGFTILELSDDCDDSVKEVRGQLEKLAEDIGEAFAYETWLKMMVKEALKTTEDEYLMIINENTARTEDAAITVVN